MKIEKTFIDGLFIIQPDIFTDDRGYFYESFSAKRFVELGISETFVQDNFSRSVKNTIRGLHYQIGEYAQGKLCSVISGRVIDVAVDIRFGSPTFGKHVAVELSDENKLQFWMPPGFAHGFAVLSDYAVFHYKCTAYFSRNYERTILYNDPVLKINWRIKNPIVSEKDKEALSFDDIGKDFIY
ncbi:MAG: dTDP-4-dehydrorhamnose 3,5-epimerase [Ignavibacteria bacterium RBG_13_36_8]|nr:MAG: dTDP-4-dehydrorhamnose 3,5-epimerase [Ignavibacteria bacterium RBG_13_36_8]